MWEVVPCVKAMRLFFRSPGTEMPLFLRATIPFFLLEVYMLPTTESFCPPRMANMSGVSATVARSAFPSSTSCNASLP